MEKTIVILFSNNKSSFEIKGIVNLPTILEDDFYNILVEDKYLRVKHIFSDYIYDSVSKLKILICVDYKEFIMTNSYQTLNPNTFFPANYNPIKSVKDISKLFFEHLVSGKIYLISFFRKNKIEKILENEEPDIKI